MLHEYFSLEIKVMYYKIIVVYKQGFPPKKDGLICSLPALLDGYSPNLDRLPYFLLCVAVEVNTIPVHT